MMCSFLRIFSTEILKNFNIIINTINNKHLAIEFATGPTGTSKSIAFFPYYIKCISMNSIIHSLFNSFFIPLHNKTLRFVKLSFSIWISTMLNFYLIIIFAKLVDCSRIKRVMSVLAINFENELIVARWHNQSDTMYKLC